MFELILTQEKWKYISQLKRHKIDFLCVGTIVKVQGIRHLIRQTLISTKHLSLFKRPTIASTMLNFIHKQNKLEAHNMNKTELVFILDRSGSMSGLESDTIGGFNAMLEKQQAEPGKCRITTVLFDHAYEVLHDRIDIKAVNKLTAKEYFVRGTTALLDAVGNAINKIDNAQKNTAEDHRAEKVLFVITTDGMENASREFSYDKIKSMIERQKAKHNWEFIFLGANIDAVEVAGRFGIARERAQTFHNDSKGISLNYDVLSDAVCSFRAAPACASIPDDWSTEIDADYKRRKKK